MYLVINDNSINTNNYVIRSYWDFLEYVMDFLITKAICGIITIRYVVDVYFIVRMGCINVSY